MAASQLAQLLAEYENADLAVPGEVFPAPERDLNSILSVAGARLNDKLEGGISGLLNAVMAPGAALQGEYNQRPIFEDGSVGQFDPRMIEDAASLSGLVSLGVAPIPRPSGSIGMGGRSGANFQDYLGRVNPNRSRISPDDRPNLGMGDMYGMLPRGSTHARSSNVEGFGDVNYMRSPSGDYYAMGFNPDVGELDVLGYAMNRGDAVELAVAQELQRRGIGSELQYLFRSENPYAQSGGLTEAGENSLRRVYDRLISEGILNGR